MVGRSILACLAFGTMVIACAPAAGDDDPGEGSDQGLSGSSCNSTAAEIQIRAFIPTGPLGSYTDAHGNTCPTGDPARDGAPLDYGFPEPGQLPGTYVPSLFHGDHRGFTTVWNDASRMIGEIDVAMQAPGACGKLGTVRNVAGTSHRCGVFLGQYTADAQTASVHEDVNDQSCLTTDVWKGDYQIDSGYPFSALAPHIFDELEVHSRATADERDAQGNVTKQTQHFTVYARHTPFPFHEVVVRYACGTKTMSLVSFTSPFTAPGFDDLGGGHATESVQTAHFSLSVDLAKPRGVVVGP